MQQKYYYCYDRDLHHYLYKNGCKYITQARHLKTNKVFTLYEVTEEVQHYLTKWQQSKEMLK